MPPSKNANFAFIQHMLYHLKEEGFAGTVMANGSLSVQGTEGEIRRKIIEKDLVDAIIALPGELFYTTPIPVCLWIFSKGKGIDKYRDRRNETLFIDAREMYEEVNRTLNTLPDEAIDKIANKVRAYRGEEEAGTYEDEKGFCAVATIDEIEENNWIITPGRYVGIENEENNGGAFEVKMEELTADLREQFQRSNDLQEQIEENLEEIGF